MNAINEYWREMIAEALDQVGISADEKQIVELGDLVAELSESYDEHSGSNPPPNINHDEEVVRLERQLANERAKTPCGDCNGRGGDPVMGLGGRMGFEPCDTCNGSGRN